MFARSSFDVQRSWSKCATGLAGQGAHNRLLNRLDEADVQLFHEVAVFAVAAANETAAITGTLLDAASAASTDRRGDEGTTMVNSSVQTATHESPIHVAFRSPVPATIRGVLRSKAKESGLWSACSFALIVRRIGNATPW
jgi:hypothetical protein